MARLSFIQWFGGKGNLVPFLRRFLPPHRFYAELFGGGAALLLNKEPAEREYYNDLDERLWRLFTAVKEDERFRVRADFLIYSRSFYRKVRQADDALSLYFNAKSSFSGRISDGWCYAIREMRIPISKHVSAFLSSIASLPLVYSRLHNVEITNLDWRQWIEKYQPNTRDWLFYLDPPYVHSTRKKKRYVYEMTDSDHEELIDFCLRAKCKIMLSGYENPLYARLEQAGWRKVLKETACHAAGRIRGSNLRGKGSARKHQKRVECLWMNY